MVTASWNSMLRPPRYCREGRGGVQKDKGVAVSVPGGALPRTSAMECCKLAHTKLTHTKLTHTRPHRSRQAPGPP